ncbi:MAG TPA: SIMPL domain-containing protein [Candidatus Paceibacterota bacterium]
MTFNLEKTKNIVLILVALTFLFIVGSSLAENVFGLYLPNTQKQNIEVEGVVREFIIPNEMQYKISMSVDREAVNNQAMQQIQITEKRLMDTLKTLGVNSEDIMKEDYDVYSIANNKERAIGNLVITIRDKDIIKDVKSLIVWPEISSVGRIGNFSVNDIDKKIHERLEAGAVAMAEEKIASLAKNLGGKVGPIENFKTDVSISYGNLLPADVKKYNDIEKEIGYYVVYSIKVTYRVSF